MAVIGLLVGIGLLILIYVLVKKFDQKMEKEFKHTFFTWGKFSTVVVANWIIYFGINWYESAVNKNGDIFNGVALIVLGVIVYLLWIFFNISQTNLKFGVIGSLFSGILFLPGSILALFALLAAYGALMQTRPVYRMN